MVEKATGGLVPATAGSTRENRVDSLGIKQGMIVQELGWDDDVDETLRDDIMDALDADMVDQADEAVDAVLMWWRESDGDLTDGLVDAMVDLGSQGFVCLLTPKVGQKEHVEPADIAEAAQTAGFAVTTPVNVTQTWQALRLVRGKGSRK